MPGRKHTYSQVKARREEVMRHVAAGTLSTAKALALAKKHKVSMQSIWRDQRVCLEELRKAQPEGQAEEEREWWLRAMQDTYVEAREAGEYGAASSIMDKLGKAMGVYEPQKVEVSGPGGLPLAQPTEADLRAAAAAIVAELGDGANDE